MFNCQPWILPQHEHVIDGRMLLVIMRKRSFLIGTTTGTSYSEHLNTKRTME